MVKTNLSNDPVMKRKVPSKEYLRYLMLYRNSSQQAIQRSESSGYEKT